MTKPHNLHDTEEYKAKMSKAMKKAWKEKGIGNSGKHFTTEHKNRISNSMIGNERTEETKNKISESRKKNYKIIYFDNTEEIVHGLKDFCEKTNRKYDTVFKAYKAEKSTGNILKIELIK